MKKKIFQYTEDGKEKELSKSRSQLKRESTQAQEDAMKLLKYSTKQLREEGYSENLIKAIAEYHKIKSKEAKRRQMQFIGKLMRENS